MMLSTQIQLLRVSTAAIAIILASLPFFIQTSLFTMLVIMPSALLAMLFIAALAEQALMERPITERKSAKIFAFSPLQPVKFSALRITSTCKWAGCKCAA